MGEELVEHSSPSYTEQFCDAFPYYLSIGMSYDQFWNDDCTLVRFYRKAEEIRQERVNREAWLQGAYFYEAMTRVSPVLNGFAKKGTKPIKYMEDPFTVSAKQAEIKEEQQVKKTFNKGQAFMAKFMVDTNKKMEGK